MDTAHYTMLPTTICSNIIAQLTILYFPGDILALCVIALMSPTDSLSGSGINPKLPTAATASFWPSDPFACVTPHEESLENLWEALVSSDQFGNCCHDLSLGMLSNSVDIQHGRYIT